MSKGLCKNNSSPPPLLRDVQERGALAGLVAWVGNHWVGVGRKFVFKGFLPQILCVWGDLTFFCQGSLPLLSVVQEVGTLVGLVDQVGARLVRSGLEVVLLYLVARSPPQERRLRRKFCEGFVP